ncbi:hypothetical protein BSM4216_0816 [Bacillus smithii]|nr:hypothetical protein BSM4216_0816 [Bacillus smithii]
MISILVKKMIMGIKTDCNARYCHLRKFQKLMAADFASFPQAN